MRITARCSSLSLRYKTIIYSCWFDRCRLCLQNKAEAAKLCAFKLNVELRLYVCKHRRKLSDSTEPENISFLILLGADTPKRVLWQ